MKKLFFSLLFLAAYHAAAATWNTDASPTVAEIQALINGASVGDEIVVANGAYNFGNGTIQLNKAVTLRAQTDRGVTLTCNMTAEYTYPVVITKQAAGSPHLRGFIFRSTVFTAFSSTSYIACVGAWHGTQPPLVSECDFYGEGTFPFYLIDWRTVGGGVIWNCRFFALCTYGAWLGGLQFRAHEYSMAEAKLSWATNSSMGLAGDPTGKLNTYVEDCFFSLGYNSICNGEGGARIVFRYNSVTNGTVSSHGADTGDQPGVRHQEIYGNRFVYDAATDFCQNGGMNSWIYSRGGTGVTFSNIMPDIPGGKCEMLDTIQSIRRAGGWYGCKPIASNYPNPHQLGQGYVSANAVFHSYVAGTDFAAGDGLTADRSYYISAEPWYYWQNGNGAFNAQRCDLDYAPANCNGQLTMGQFYQLGRDYALSPKPNYTAYTYPHPLRSGQQSTNPPAIVLQPQNVTVDETGNATFSVAASGSSPLNYLWRLNGTSAGFANADNFTLVMVTTGMSGRQYDCVITNNYGSVTSSVAVLTVNAVAHNPPTITLAPVSATRLVGDSVTFSTQASGFQPLAFQWQSNNVNIGNATSSNYTISVVALGHAGNYRAIVTNLYGAVTSSVAVLTVTSTAADKYVDNTAGNDANTGLFGAPWKFCPGMSNYTGTAIISPGTTVYFDRADTWPVANADKAGWDLYPGVHYVGDTWDPSSAGAGRAKIMATNRCGASIVRFRYDHPTFATWLEGFDITGSVTNIGNGIGIQHPYYNPDGLRGALKRISNCVVHDLAGNRAAGDFVFGIIVSDNSPDASASVSHVEILDSTVYNVPISGIAIYPGPLGRVEDVLVRGCYVYGVTNDSVENHGLAVRGDVRGANFIFNVVSNVLGSAVYIAGPEYWLNERGPSNIVVQCNILSTAPTSTNGIIRCYDGISPGGNKQVDIVANIIQHTNQSGAISFAGNQGTLTARIYNNTIWDTVVDIGDPTGATTIDFQNNIISTFSNFYPTASLTDAGSDVTTHGHNIYGTHRISGTCLVVIGGVCKTSFDVAGVWEPSAVMAATIFMDTNAPPTGFTGTYPNLVPNPNGLSINTTNSFLDMGAPLGNQFSTAINSVTRSSSMSMANWDVGAYEQMHNDPPIPPQPTPVSVPGVKNATILIIQ